MVITQTFKLDVSYMTNEDLSQLAQEIATEQSRRLNIDLSLSPAERSMILKEKYRQAIDAYRRRVHCELKTAYDKVKEYISQLNGVVDALFEVSPLRDFHIVIQNEEDNIWDVSTAKECAEGNCNCPSH